VVAILASFERDYSLCTKEYEYLQKGCCCQTCFFLLRHFGHLSRNSIETRRNSTH